jgi:hypothetical protein
MTPEIKTEYYLDLMRAFVRGKTGVDIVDSEALLSYGSAHG